MDTPFSEETSSPHLLLSEALKQNFVPHHSHWELRRGLREEAVIEIQPTSSLSLLKTKLVGNVMYRDRHNEYLCSGMVK